MNKPLWTRDFTIITLGTVVSMLGNAISGFAIGLLVLDYTGSTLMFAIFTIAYSLPKIFMPFLAGPYLDKFSRKKMIYVLDFISAGIYLGMFFWLRTGTLSYGLLLAVCLIIGSIDSVYQVAYDSLYPTLISEGNYTKAYSISSMIYPLSAIMVPIAAYVYEEYGNLEPLFLFNAATFLIAAIFETQIKANEDHVKSTSEQYNFKTYVEDFKDGFKYIKYEKGLLVITAYFFANTLIGSASGVLLLPYFKAAEGLGVMSYTYIIGCSVIGRLIGGMIHYRFKYPTAMKFSIAMGVYIISSAIEGGFLFLPVIFMMILQFLSGLLCVTSFNIRISSTQNYVPNDMRARFNGAFLMLTNLGSIIGQLIFGALGDALPIRNILAVSYGICIVCAIVIMYGGRKHVKPIYNVDV